MIKAKIIGAGGYGGVGITELLIRHPNAEVGALVDVENVGTPISTLYPHLTGFCDAVIQSPEQVADQSFDVAFMATPDGVGMKLAAGELAKGTKVIDYSGDFRFNTAESYAAYASRIGLEPAHANPELLTQSVYGIAELHREQINPDRMVVGNPGCFAVSSILGLSPAAKAGMIQPGTIICDCKTGVSGAGKNPHPTFHYPARYDHMNAYKLAGHQHVCEIERELELQAGVEMPITFTAHVVPVCRGIMSTLYATLTSDITEAELLETYRQFYAQDTFVRVFDSVAPMGSSHVRGTNYCNLVVSVDERMRRLRVVSYIDNLVKGQAGSACQNMNLIFGFEETAGLNRPGMHP